MRWYYLVRKKIVDSIIEYLAMDREPNAEEKAFAIIITCIICLASVALVRVLLPRVDFYWQIFLGVGLIWIGVKAIEQRNG